MSQSLHYSRAALGVSENRRDRLTSLWWQEYVVEEEEVDAVEAVEAALALFVAARTVIVGDRAMGLRSAAGRKAPS